MDTTNLIERIKVLKEGVKGINSYCEGARDAFQEVLKILQEDDVSASKTIGSFLQTVASGQPITSASVIITLIKGIKNPNRIISNDERILITLGLNQFLTDGKNDWLAITTFFNSF